MRLTEGQILGVATCPNVVFVQVWPARVLEIPVRNPDAFAGRIGARVRLEIEEEVQDDNAEAVPVFHSPA